jgi:SHS2 domain-containing protein
MADHTFEEHVGEVRLRLFAEDLGNLFAEAGRALAELMADVPRAPSADAPTEEVVVRARDRGALLVEWINELVYRSETRKKVYTAVEIDAIDDHELHAHIRGVDAINLRTAVKAATYHDLRIDEQGGRLNASIILDV